MDERFPNRKPTRLKGYNYKTNGCYFITICTEGKKCIFSEIVGEGFPLPKLTSYGNIAEKWINKIPEKYPTVEVERFVIMPNHIHLLLLLSNDDIGGRGNPSPTNPLAVERELTYNADGRGNPSPTITSIVDVVAWLKYRITQECNIGGKRKKLLQRSFHDHIVRNDEDYQQIARYIQENPLKWELDCFYTKQ